MQVSCQEVLRSLLEGLRWLQGRETPAVPVAGESGISQARSRLGWEPMRQLHDALVVPIATPQTRGAWSGRWRLVSLVENGTHVLFGSQWGPYATTERTLAAAVIERLQPGMLCMADRGFYGYTLWQAACQTGADLLWRIQKNVQLPVEQRLADGSFLTHVYPNAAARARRPNSPPSTLNAGRSRPRSMSSKHTRAASSAR